MKPSIRALGLSVALLATLPCAARADGPLPRVSTGSIERLPAVASQFVEARDVDIWLPPGYPSAGRYAVLYMMDGQMLYDPATGWNGQSWRVQDALSKLLGEGRMPPTIVVGIHNSGATRHSEFFPENALPYLAEPLRSQFIGKGLAGRPRANAYLQFLVAELKPVIDRRYATLADARHTWLMGSSMGAIVSLYAMSEYPGVFGAAACLSSNWYGSAEDHPAIGRAALAYFAQRIPDAASHRLYMDHGTLGLDAGYGPYQAAFDAIAQTAGYGEGNWKSLVFAGKSHTEVDWAARVDGALEFLGAGLRDGMAR
jgi:enterochelin esterase-like enzyme